MKTRVPPLKAASPSPRARTLAMSARGDASEREADGVAEQLAGSSAARVESAGVNASGRAPEGLAEALAELGGGEPLPAADRAFFEPRFRHDFSHVRVHSGPAAGELAAAVRARAFTVGDAIVLRDGHEGGRHLLAHELTHVVQQAGGTPLVQRDNDTKYGYDDPNDPIWSMGPPPVRPGPVRTTRLRSDPTFLRSDLEQLDKQGVALSFSGSLAPIPDDAQKVLLDNIVATVRFALNPNDPVRVRERERLKKAAGKKPEDEFNDQPTIGLDSTDLYHGHLGVPRAVLQSSPNLQKLRDNPFSGFAKDPNAPTPGKDYRKAIGVAPTDDRLPANKDEAQKILAVADKYRPQYYETLGALLKALANEPTAGIMYHSWETVPLPKPDETIRNIFTPLQTHQPRFSQSGKERDSDTLLNIGFQVDRRTGKITLFPGSEKQFVRAFEMLQFP